MIEIYFKSLVRATGKVLLVKFSDQLNPIKVVKNVFCLKTNNCFGGPHQ